MYISPPIMRPEDGATVMESRDDLSLLQAIAQHRDKEAFAELYQRYEQRAFNLAARILRNPALAQDAFQDAMLSIWLSEKPIDLRNAENWIMRIVLTKTLKLRRGYWRSASLHVRASATKSKPEPTAADEAEQNELIKLLREQIDQLPELESTLLTCSFAANLPHREIAKLVNMPQRTVSRRIQQALLRLRSDLAKAGIAAVVPALSSSQLFEALTTGYTCPPGGMNELMQRIDAADLAPQSPSRRIDAAQRGSWTPLAAGLMVLAAASVGVVLALRSGGLAAVNVAPSAVQNEKAHVSATAAVNSRNWDFNTKEQADAFKVINGTWRWVADGGPDGSGCMETTSENFDANIDLWADDKPRVVAFKCTSLPPQPRLGYSTLVLWGHYQELVEIDGVSMPYRHNADVWYDILVYISRRSVDVWIGGHRTNFMLNRPLPGTQATLRIRGLNRIDNLSIREINTSDLPPDTQAIIDAVDRIPAEKRAGTVELPGLPAVPPAGNASAIFHPGEQQ